MTTEQEKQVEAIQKAKEWLEKWDSECDDHSVHNMDPDDVAGIAEGLLNTNRNLLAIVDDLRKQTGEQAEKIQAFSDEFAAMLTVERELQAKLKEQAETIEVNAKYCIELQGIIQEKAREIERLKKKHGTWEVEFRA